MTNKRTISCMDEMARLKMRRGELEVCVCLRACVNDGLCVN